MSPLAPCVSAQPKTWMRRKHPGRFHRPFKKPT
ncbi:umcharacterized LOC128092248 homolog [Sorex araneus]|nr:umcharacterized LOC128092248 homolog [Sorex araneus]